MFLVHFRFFRTHHSAFPTEIAYEVCFILGEGPIAAGRIARQRSGSNITTSTKCMYTAIIVVLRIGLALQQQSGIIIATVLKL